jgi:hypothetical protein
MHGKKASDVLSNTPHQSSYPNYINPINLIPSAPSIPHGTSPASFTLSSPLAAPQIQPVNVSPAQRVDIRIITDDYVSPVFFALVLKLTHCRKKSWRSDMGMGKVEYRIYMVLFNGFGKKVGKHCIASISSETGGSCHY